MKRMRHEDAAHPHLVPMIRMIAAVPLLPICAFAVWTGTVLPLALPYPVLSGQHIMQIKVILIE